MGARATTSATQQLCNSRCQGRTKIFYIQAPKQDRFDRLTRCCMTPHLRRPGGRYDMQRHARSGRAWWPTMSSVRRLGPNNVAWYALRISAKCHHYAAVSVMTAEPPLHEFKQGRPTCKLAHILSQDVVHVPGWAHALDSSQDSAPFNIVWMGEQGATKPLCNVCPRAAPIECS